MRISCPVEQFKTCRITVKIKWIITVTCCLKVFNTKLPKTFPYFTCIDYKLDYIWTPNAFYITMTISNQCFRLVMLFSIIVIAIIQVLYPQPSTQNQSAQYCRHQNPPCVGSRTQLSVKLHRDVMQKTECI